MRAGDLPVEPDLASLYADMPAALLFLDLPREVLLGIAERIHDTFELRSHTGLPC